jgi:thiol-disulfide isomerase/thioredoxin
MYKLLGLVFLLSMAFLPERPVTIVNLQQYQNIAIRPNDTLYVVNFWATWCKPCVHEMPYFEAENQKFKNQKVKFIFVSTNYAREAEQVKSFINQKQVQADVLLLNAGNPNNWIDAIDSSWSGAIPATIMYRKGRKALFYEGEFTQSQLDSVIQKQIL